MLDSILSAYSIRGEILSESVSPLAKTYSFKPALGQKLNKIRGLADEIALHLGVSSCRIHLKGGLLSFEIPIEKREIIKAKPPKNDLNLNINLGVGIDGKELSFDLTSLPHLLVAGATGSGKSVCLNVIVKSLINNPYTNLVIIDPKKVEFEEYKDRVSFHATTIESSLFALKELVRIMEERYETYQKMGVKNYSEYYTIQSRKYKLNPIEENKWDKKIVCIIDEFADLMMTSKKETESLICRLAQLARAAGIHIILATQRPSADVITGIIRSNMPAKIAFKVAKKSDSRIILDESGAEQLTGRGDGLFLKNETVRFQCAM